MRPSPWNADAVPVISDLEEVQEQDGVILLS